MSALTDINTVRTIQHVRKSLEAMLANMIDEPCDAQTRGFIKGMIDSYLRDLAGKRMIWGSNTTTKHAIGYDVASSKHVNRCVYLLSDGGVYPIRKRFSGRRTARVFGKRNWKSWMGIDLQIQPIVPTSYVVISAVISNVEETKIKES